MISKDTLIGELVYNHPEAAMLLIEEGVHCIGCGAANYETLEQGLLGHGKNEKEIDEIIKAMNDLVENEEED
jgi:hybrid cluster-associated redox disulfide protein